MKSILTSPSNVIFKSKIERFVALFDTLISPKHATFWAWTIWACVSLAALCFVAVFSLHTPYVDEWEWIGRATGNEPVTLSWLWSQHNEHRMFLPRLIYLGLGAISGFDFRAGSFFNVLILSGLSFALMLAARSVRGRTRICDAFFPLLLLHWGQFENLIWGFQLNFVTSVVLEGVLLLMILRCGDEITLKLFGLVAFCLVLLGLCGTYAVVYLPPMVCWLCYASVRKWRSGGPHARRDAPLMFVLAAAPAALAAMYFQGIYARAYTPGFYASLRTGIQFISFGIGPGAKEIWPISGLLVLIVCTTIVWKCLMVFRNHPAHRIRAAGFLMYLAGIIALATAIGLGRAFIGPIAGFEPRYMTLAVPLMLLLFLLCETYGNAALKRHLPRTLFIMMALLFFVNAQKGISHSTNLWRHLAGFERDMRDGIPADALGLRYADQWGHVTSEIFSTRLAWLRNARLGPYRLPTPKSGEAVRVEGIGRQGTESQKIEPIRLAAGQSFTQRFSVGADGELRRIDLQISLDRQACSIKRLNWALFKVAADGEQDLLAKDYIDPNEVRGEYYVSIPLKNISARKSQRFELVLLVPGDAPQEAFVEIPLYQAAGSKETQPRNNDGNRLGDNEFAGSLKGFVFLEANDRSSPILARRPEEGF